MPLICTECGWAKWSLSSAAREDGGSRVPLPRRTNRRAHTARCHARSVQSPRAPAGQKWFKWVVCMQHPRLCWPNMPELQKLKLPAIHVLHIHCAPRSCLRCALMPSFGARRLFPSRSASPLHPASPQRRERRPCAASRCPAHGRGRARPAQRRWATAQAGPFGAAPTPSLAQAHPVGAAPLGAGLPEGDRMRGAVDQERVAGHAELRTVLVVAAVACAARADMMGRAHARRPPLAGRSRGLGSGGAAKDSRGARSACPGPAAQHQQHASLSAMLCFLRRDMSDGSKGPRAGHGSCRNRRSSLRARWEGRACNDGYEQRARGALGRAHAQRGPARVVRRVERVAAEQRDDLRRLRLCRTARRTLLC